MNSKQNISGAGLAIGLGLIAIASVIGFDTVQMRVPPTYARVGPQIFPYIIAIGMAITGAHIAWKSYRGGDEVIDEVEPTDWKSVGIIVAGLIAHMNLLKPLGFVPAGLILFLSVAFAFGSRRYGRDAIVGFLLVLFAYVGFTYGLGLQLPPGILKGLL
ncbi:MAG TPA: tripartite tricarboxylate transporter TctB family protein [Aestuariivirga sp.]|jgi:putative tricarboxylic transport membrane protein|nr:tripartite tricarboxylate transporter TctB family protein [Aestuariivirga sp.]